MRDLADVQQTVFAGQQVDQGAKVQNLGDRAFVDLADFNFSGDLLDATFGFLRLGRISRGDGDGAIFIDVDLGAGLFGQRTDDRAALADHVTDLLGVDLHGEQARGEGGHFGLGLGHGFLHLAQNVHARFLGLCQCDLHDFLGNALDLDVHLQRGDAVGGTGHLEVHIAQMIFVTQDVGQHGKAVFFLDQTHGDTRHVGFHGHASVHQGEAAAADRSHRRGAVGLGDFRDHAHGVGELFLAWQHCHQRTLGQTTVADFAALGRTDATRFASGERRHVVVQHETVFVLTGQGVDALGIALGAQGGDHQSLGFTTREQGGTVGAGQHAVADFDGTHGTGVAAINTRLAGQNLAAHNLGFNVKQHAFHSHAVKRDTIELQVSHHDRIRFAASAGTGLLVADLVSSSQFLTSQRADLGDQRLVLDRCFPVPHRLAGVTHQFVNRVDGNVALLMTEHHGAEHDFFRQLLGFGFHHQHGGFGACHHQIKDGILAGGLTWVEHIFAIDVTHAGGTDRAAEWDATDGQRGADRDQSGNIRINFRVQGQGVDHHMHFVEKSFWEQGANRTVDQAAGQRFKLAGTAFAFEEAAGDLASGIGLFKVIDGQGEEVLTSLAFGLGNHGRQHHGAIHVQQHGAAGLASDFAGFHGDGVLTPLEGLGDFVEYAHIFLLINLGSAGHLARARIRHHRTRCHSREIQIEFIWNDTASLRYCLLRSKKRLS